MNNRITVIALIVIGLALPLASATATGVGDVTIKIHPNGPMANTVHTCENQRFDIWIKNDAPLYELSLGFKLSCVFGPFTFQTYGTLPVGAPVLKIDEPASVGAFDNGVTVEYSQDSSLLFIRGSAIQTPLPIHTVSTRVYSFMIDASYTVWSGGVEPVFCLDNIVNSATGTWSFTDSQIYSPTYCGVANTLISDPSAPSKCFPNWFIPCLWPELTVVPPSSVTIGTCDLYSFQLDYLYCQNSQQEFEKDEQTFIPYGVWFAKKGSITDFGLYSYEQSAGDTVVVDTVIVQTPACLSDSCFFVLNFIHSAPQITLCNQFVRVKAGTSRAVQFNMTDPDLCESHVWTLEQLAPTAPQSVISINPETGIVTVDANPLDIGATFDYRLTCTDQFGKFGSCAFALKVVDIVPGDADGNGLLTISDVVWLINYIFGGPVGEEIPIDRVDSDCNLMCNISDAVYLINYIFVGGPEPC